MTTKAKHAAENTKHRDLIAKASVSIRAPVAEVWKALITPVIVKRYMAGTEVVSDWEQGGPIAWKGEWKGKPYQDKGTILKIEPEKLLQYTHHSPTSGLPDKPENYHTVTYELSESDGVTLVELSQDNNADKKFVEHSQDMWKEILDGLKRVVEGIANTR